MAITLPYTFTDGTTADADEVNANFDALSTGAVNKTGDTMTGALTVSSGGITVSSGHLTLGAAQTIIMEGTSDDAFELTLTCNPTSSDKTITFPDATDTLVGLAVTQTLTNKTLTSPSIATPTITGLTTLTGGQIAFPASQSASSGANTLDDYEEGTFTPTDGSGAGLTFTTPVGQYVKVGKLVMAWLALTYPATVDGSAAIIASLPFTSDTFTNGTYAAAVGNTNDSTDIRAYVASAQTSVTLIANSGAAVTNADLTGRSLSITVMYRASA